MRIPLGKRPKRLDKIYLDTWWANLVALRSGAMLGEVEYDCRCKCSVQIVFRLYSHVLTALYFVQLQKPGLVLGLSGIMNQSYSIGGLRFIDVYCRVPSHSSCKEEHEERQEEATHQQA